MKILLTTVPGLESIVVEEIIEKLGRDVSARYSPLSGRVFVEVEEPNLPHILSLHSIENARIILNEAGNLQEAIEGSLSFLSRLTKGRGVNTFAVRGERVTKEPSFTSLDIAREVGKILVEKLQLRVQLDAPDLVIYTEYENGTYRLGVDLTPFASLRDRPYRVWVHKSALNPIIAYALCRLARPFTRILDPFCGSGTIVLECLSIFREAEAVCSDVSYQNIAGARTNSLAISLNPNLLVQDIRLSAVRAGLEFDAIISNPPFGIRERAVGGLDAVYRALFNLADETLKPGGRLVVLSPHKRLVERYSSKLRPVSVMEISEGGLKSWIHVYTKP